MTHSQSCPAVVMNTQGEVAPPGRGTSERPRQANTLLVCQRRPVKLGGAADLHRPIHKAPGLSLKRC